MHQLSFAFLQFRRHTTELPAGIAASIEASRPVTLHKIEPAKNMARFYALEVEQDLFGCHVLVRRWGRIGTAGKIRLKSQNSTAKPIRNLSDTLKAMEVTYVG